AAAKAARDTLNKGSLTNAELGNECATVAADVAKATPPLDDKLRKQGVDCAAFLAAETNLENAQAKLQWSRQWQARRANVSDGQILFETYCARCHTEGWSIFDPSVPPPAVNSVTGLGLSGGGGGTGGGIGFNLRAGDTRRRFGPDQSGFDAQVK